MNQKHSSPNWHYVEVYSKVLFAGSPGTLKTSRLSPMAIFVAGLSLDALTHLHSSTVNIVDHGLLPIF
ncbi:MAG: hypothetical protein ACMUHX_01795 [bacterium]